jgi:orotate phosphoribosyltransferase
LAAQLVAHRPDSILSPALGGLIIGHEVAAVLGIPFRFVERKEGEMTLRRGFELAKGERVVVIEDVITTGGSCLEAVAVARDHGADVVAVGAIIDRSSADSAFDVPYEHLLVLDFPTYDGSACPLCAEGSEAIKPGSRSELK